MIWEQVSCLNASSSVAAGPMPKAEKIAAEDVRRRKTGAEKDLREIVRTNDAVLVSAIGALLDGAQISHIVLDQNMSVLEGSLGILPRRVLVADDDAPRARKVIEDAGLSHELRPDAG